MFKTGTSTVVDALKILGYPCIVASCSYQPIWDHLRDWQTPYFVGSDDISWFLTKRRHGNMYKGFM